MATKKNTLETEEVKALEETIEKAPRKILVEIDDVEYTLEYNRAAIRDMESRGFALSHIEDRIVTSLDLLVQGALYKNHRTIRGERLEELCERIVTEYDSNELISVLTSMLLAAIPELQPNKKSEGTPKKVFTVIK